MTLCWCACDNGQVVPGTVHFKGRITPSCLYHACKCQLLNPVWFKTVNILCLVVLWPEGHAHISQRAYDCIFFNEINFVFQIWTMTARDELEITSIHSTRIASSSARTRKHMLASAQAISNLTPKWAFADSRQGSLPCLPLLLQNLKGHLLAPGIKSLEAPWYPDPVCNYWNYSNRNCSIWMHSIFNN